MNKRIKELAERAGAYELSYGYYRGEKKPENCVAFHSIDLEMFAELIVQECVKICTEGNQIEKVMGLYYSKQIKKHFGVE